MQLHTNNGTAALALGINTSQTTVTVAAGSGSLFASPTAHDYQFATLFKRVNNQEIKREVVKITARAGDVLTVVRAQDGFVGLSFDAGDFIEPRVNAGLLDCFVQGRPNEIINGDFSVWQLGTSFASPTVSADMWQHGAGATVTQQAFAAPFADIPNCPAYFMRISRATSVITEVAINYIEDWQRVSGRTVTISFWAKGTAGKVLEVDVLSIGLTPAFDSTDTHILLTPSWKFYTATIAIPAAAAGGANPRYYFRIFDTASVAGAFTLDVANFKVEIGDKATPFVRTDYATELAKCQRYLQIVGAGFTGMWLSANEVEIVGKIPTMAYSPTMSLFSTSFGVAEANIALRSTTTGSINAGAGVFTTPKSVRLRLLGFTGATANRQAFSDTDMLIAKAM